LERGLLCDRCRLQLLAGKDMKIYLLMMLIGTLLTAVRFTSAPKPQSKPVRQ